MCFMLILSRCGSWFPCSGGAPNNLNQVAVHANTCGVYPDEIAGLQRDYQALWSRVSAVLNQLAAIVDK